MANLEAQQQQSLKKRTRKHVTFDPIMFAFISLIYEKECIAERDFHFEKRKCSFARLNLAIIRKEIIAQPNQPNQTQPITTQPSQPSNKHVNSKLNHAFMNIQMHVINGYIKCTAHSSSCISVFAFCRCCCCFSFFSIFFSFRFMVTVLFMNKCT